MSEEEIVKAYEEMVALWGDKLPNPEQEPIRFQYYVNMYMYFKERQ